MRRITYTAILCTVLCSACSRYKPAALTVINNADTNWESLQEFVHDQQGNRQRLNAAYYLIAGMEGKYSFNDTAGPTFQAVIGYLDSLHSRKINVPVASPLLSHYWDSLTAAMGHPSLNDIETVPDAATIDRSILDDNLNYALQAWTTLPWAKGLSEQEYYDYILPYRLGTEKTEKWRGYLFNKYKSFRDTLTTTKRLEIAERLNLLMRKQIALNHTMRNYPFDMTVAEMEKAKRGSCRQLVFYTAKVMRANGLPVAVDYANYWGDLDKGHEWNAILLENGKMRSFDAAQAEFEPIPEKMQYRLSKVFRTSFQKIKKQYPKIDFPNNLKNDWAYDVTEEYVKTANLTIPLTIPSKRTGEQVAFICTYGKNNWLAQDWAMIRNNRCAFKKMGTNLLYLVMYYIQGKYYPATEPFIVSKEGAVTYIPNTPTAAQQISVSRKYPYFRLNKINAQDMVGGIIEGANKPDFSDADTLHLIRSIPEKIERITLPVPKKYTYVRYLSARNHKTNLAELKLFKDSLSNPAEIRGTIIGMPHIAADQGTDLSKAFDNNFETYFSGIKDSLSWTGLALNKATMVTQVWFAPRSDCNYIIPGDQYELSYWDGSSFKNVGIQPGITDKIVFKNVPSNKIYLLHDKTKGQEERIFTYQNGQQVWW